MCEIRWIDENGNPTSDNNEPIGYVRCKRYDYHPHIARPTRKPWAGEYSQWFAICAEHAKRLDAPGMQDWEFEPSNG